MIVVTGATGELGRLAIKALLKRVPAKQIIAAARTPSKAEDIAASGVEVREADYGKPETLKSAFVGATKVLLISSPSMGIRVGEHKAVIDAAKDAGVTLIAYTSVLRAEESTLLVAADHVATERYLAKSGIPWVFLRNGPYFENRTAALASAVEHGAIVGSAGDARISAATRADFAEAAAVVLTSPGHEGKIYELGGDTAFRPAEFAAEVSKQSGKTIPYNDMPMADYQAILESVGLPAELANLVADTDTKAFTEGELYTDSHDLRDLIGRPTTTLSAAVAEALPR